MVVAQATKLCLPNPSLSSPQITSLLFEPHSLSLALMHSDSSFSLYPSFSPLSISSLPPPQVIVPSPCSSAAFVVLQSSDSNSDSKVLFVVSGPHKGGSQILLRLYILESCKLFRKARVVCTQKDLRVDDKLGVLVDCKHGLSVRLAGSVNFFAMFSVSSLKVWVFAVKMVADNGDGDNRMVFKLMRCAVIDCCKPIWSISLSFGFLLLGEDNGVRVVNLRPFMRGRARKVRNQNPNTTSNAKREVHKLFLPNGEVCGISGGTDLNVGSLVIGNEGINAQASKNDDAESSAICNGSLDGKFDKHCVSVRPRSVKLRQSSGEGGLCFVALNGKGVEDLKSAKTMSLKAIAIQALSPQKIVILDSVGDLHLLHLARPANGSDFSCNIWPLPHIMKVQMLASLPHVSIRNRTVWLSDGRHSVHMMVTPDNDSDVTENGENEIEENLMKLSVMQVIFVGEKIQDIMSLSANGVLVLGQACMHMQFPEVSSMTLLKMICSRMGGFSASCSAQIFVMWSLLIMLSQYNGSQAAVFSICLMRTRFKETQLLTGPLGCFLMEYYNSEDEVLQQLKASTEFTADKHACWLLVHLFCLSQLVLPQPAIMKATTEACSRFYYCKFTVIIS